LSIVCLVHNYSFLLYLQKKRTKWFCKIKKVCLSEEIFAEYSHEESHLSESIWNEILPKNSVQDMSGRQNGRWLNHLLFPLKNGD